MKVVDKLFDEIAPRFEARPGGYTRLLIGPRRGDSADMAQIELVGSEYNPNLEARQDRGRGGAEGDRRPRTAARGGERLRGKAKPEAEEAEGRGRPEEESQPSGPRRQGRQDRHPRQGSESSSTAEGGRLVVNAATPQLPIPN